MSVSGSLRQTGDLYLVIFVGVSSSPTQRNFFFSFIFQMSLEYRADPTKHICCGRCISKTSAREPVKSETWSAIISWTVQTDKAATCEAQWQSIGSNPSQVGGQVTAEARWTRVRSRRLSFWPEQTTSGTHGKAWWSWQGR